MKKYLIAVAAAVVAAAASADGGHSHAKQGAKPAVGHSHAAGQGHAGDDTIGVPGQAAKVTRTVNVDMTDTMRFIPDSITAKQGETIRFVVKNSGKLKHEFVLGTQKELKEHYEQMKKFPEMEHADPNMVTVAAGKTGEVVWQFTKSGKIDFACLQPGHYEAGMKGFVTVAGGKSSAGLPIAQAQTSATTAPAATTAVAASDMVDGEVRKIDKENKKLTLKHGEIKSLQMPGMTMVFQVKDPSMLDAVKQGDKVRFKAERAGGAMVVTEIQAVQ
jgi:uncharacterized cupredoxin-like copper-binding protein/Cu/Ag efflux protein CusF